MNVRVRFSRSASSRRVTATVIVALSLFAYAVVADPTPVFASERVLLIGKQFHVRHPAAAACAHALGRPGRLRQFESRQRLDAGASRGIQIDRPQDQQGAVGCGGPAGAEPRHLFRALSCRAVSRCADPGPHVLFHAVARPGGGFGGLRFPPRRARRRCRLHPHRARAGRSHRACRLGFSRSSARRARSGALESRWSPRQRSRALSGRTRPIRCHLRRKRGRTLVPVLDRC